MSRDCCECYWQGRMVEKAFIASNVSDDRVVRVAAATTNCVKYSQQIWRMAERPTLQPKR